MTLTVNEFCQPDADKQNHAYVNAHRAGLIVTWEKQLETMLAAIEAAARVSATAGTAAAPAAPNGLSIPCGHHASAGLAGPRPVTGTLPAPASPAPPTPRPQQARRSVTLLAGVAASASKPTAKPASQLEHYYYIPYKFLLPPTATNAAQVRLPFTVTQTVLENMKPRCDLRGRRAGRTVPQGSPPVYWRRSYCRTGKTNPWSPRTALSSRTFRVDGKRRRTTRGITGRRRSSCGSTTSRCRCRRYRRRRRAERKRK